MVMRNVKLAAEYLTNRIGKVCQFTLGVLKSSDSQIIGKVEVIGIMVITASDIRLQPCK